LFDIIPLFVSGKITVSFYQNLFILSTPRTLNMNSRTFWLRNITVKNKIMNLSPLFLSEFIFKEL